MVWIIRISIDDAGQSGFQLYKTELYGTLADNKLTNVLRLKDQKMKDKYFLSGNAFTVNHGIRYIFNPDSLLLDYQRWQLPADNFVQYDSSGMIVRNLKFKHLTESVELNTKGETTLSPLDISFSNFRIKTLTQFAEQDSLLLDGNINGKAEIKDLFTKPLFTSDIKIDTLVYEKIHWATWSCRLIIGTECIFRPYYFEWDRITIVAIDGKYFSGESKMDMDIKLNQLNLASFKGVAFSQVRDMQGYLKGELHASGNLDKPMLKGSLHFDHAILVPVITGEPLKLSDNIINFDEDGFDFSNFTLLDSAGNKAVLDGNVFTKDFRNYRFDMSFSTQNFRVVNAPKEPNRLFYGKLNLNADIDVKGDLNLPKITSLYKGE